MTLIVDRTGSRHSADDRPARTTDPSTGDWTRRRIDVTDVHAAGVAEYVRSNVETDCVSLEHRGARTYLVVEG